MNGLTLDLARDFYFSVQTLASTKVNSTPLPLLYPSKLTQHRKVLILLYMKSCLFPRTYKTAIELVTCFK